jgi:hypothetical protein
MVLSLIVTPVVYFLLTRHRRILEQDTGDLEESVA